MYDITKKKPIERKKIENKDYKEMPNFDGFILSIIGIALGDLAVTYFGIYGILAVVFLIILWYKFVVKPLIDKKK